MIDSNNKKNNLSDDKDKIILKKENIDNKNFEKFIQEKNGNDYIDKKYIKHQLENFNNIKSKNFFLIIILYRVRHN